jgi:hypothetical protein
MVEVPPHSSAKAQQLGVQFPGIQPAKGRLCPPRSGLQQPAGLLFHLNLALFELLPHRGGHRLPLALCRLLQPHNRPPPLSSQSAGTCSHVAWTLASPFPVDANMMQVDFRMTVLAQCHSCRRWQPARKQASGHPCSALQVLWPLATSTAREDHAPCQRPARSSQQRTQCCGIANAPREAAPTA